MKLAQQDVATKLRAYLRHELALAEVVDSAKGAMYDGDFEDKHFMPFLRP